MHYFFKLLLILTGFVYGSLAYNVDVIEFGTNTTEPDIIDGIGHVVRPSRGVFGLSGFMHVKQDIDSDATVFEVKIYYSSNGIAYQLSPFRVPKQSLTSALNHPYKDYVMETMLQCCTNAVEVVGRFVSPLTKRLVQCENCIFPSDNFPSALRPGFYRLMLQTRTPAIAMTALLKLELD